MFNINVSIEPGETVTFEFDADRPGTYSYYCTEFCSALHLEMTGYLHVEPTGVGSADPEGSAVPVASRDQ